MSPRRLTAQAARTYAAPESASAAVSRANHASRFALHRSPIALRVSCVALPTCGSSTTLSIASSAAGMFGSSANTSRPARLDRAGLQRRDERRLVDDRAARDVDERALLAERREHFGVDDVLRRRAAGARDDRKSDCRGERLEIRHERVGHAPAACGRCTRLRMPIAASALRDRLADAAEPEDADASCRQLGRELGSPLAASRPRARSDWRARSRDRSSG